MAIAKCCQGCVAGTPFVHSPLAAPTIDGDDVRFDKRGSCHPTLLCTASPISGAITVVAKPPFSSTECRQDRAETARPTKFQASGQPCDIVHYRWRRDESFRDDDSMVAKAAAQPPGAPLPNAVMVPRRHSNPPSRRRRGDARGNIPRWLPPTAAKCRARRRPPPLTRSWRSSPAG